jgi:hypothetical protein
MTLRQSQVTDEYGRPVPGAKIYVTAADDTAAVLTTSGAAPLAQPVITDEFGIYTYYADDGIYREDTWFAAKLRYREVIAIGDAEIHLFDLAKYWAAASASSAIAAAAAAAGGVIGGIALPRLTPELYGALGDGVTDDGPALAAMSAALNALGRGVVDFYPGRTYLVGSQTFNGAVPAEYGGGVNTFAPTTPYPVFLEFCAGPVVINGNGARIKTLAGKKYGSFNEDGTVGADALPYFGVGTAGKKIATPYFAMVHVKGCTGPVAILDLELDGNIGAQVIGGEWGDSGRQISMSGIYFRDNTGPIFTRNLFSHHHGLDGGIGDGPGLLSARECVVIHGRFKNNGRQGFSMVGGNGWQFAKGCEFSGTGKDIGGWLYSLPGAGVDLEAGGGKYVLDTSFAGCSFSDNSGTCLLAPGAAVNTKGVVAKDCAFIGTTNVTLWPECPGMVFEDCVIAGSMVNFYGSDDPTLTTRFVRCRITDDVTLSPTGALYNPTGFMVFGTADKAVFDACLWEKTKVGDSINGPVADLATNSGMRLHNCMIHRVNGTGSLQVYGVYSGERTHIKGAQTMPNPSSAYPWALNAGPALDSFLYEQAEVDLPIVAFARFNATADRATGKRVFYGSAVYDPPSLAAGAKTGIQVMTVTGAVLGDKVDEVSFDKNLAGARIHAWVSAADTVSFYVLNENGANPLDLASGTVRVKVNQA